MAVKFLGALDIFATFLLLSIALDIKVSIGLLVAVIICLFLKACIAILDIGGIIDLLAVVLMILSCFIHLPLWLLLVSAISLAVKGLISLFS